MDHALGLTPADVGPALLAVPEDQWFDRKSIREDPRQLAHTLVAMANAEGGVVAIGLHDGRVEGTDAASKKRNRLMQAGRDMCAPPVRVRSRLVAVETRDGGDNLLILDVEPSLIVHATVRDEVFLRVADSDRRLGFTQRQELLYDKGQSVYETTVLPGVGQGDLDGPLLDGYRAVLDAPSSAGLLEARGLTRAGGLTVGGLLLFGRNPGEHLPNSHIRVTRFLGRERRLGQEQNIVSDERCEGPLPRVLAAAQAHIRAVQPTRRALAAGGRFSDVPLVPEDVWLEALVNAGVHRSYSSIGDHVHVDVFDDRIEVESPGRFPGLVDPSALERITRFARNPRIARVCADLSFGQEFGEGIRRMYAEMRLAGLQDPQYRQTAGSVRLVLSGLPVDRALEERMPPEARLVVEALRQAQRLSTSELAEVLGVGRPAALRRLNALRGLDVIQWHGNSAKDPRAYWALP